MAYVQVIHSKGHTTYTTIIPPSEPVEVVDSKGHTTYTTIIEVFFYSTTIRTRCQTFVYLSSSFGSGYYYLDGLRWYSSI